MEEPKQVFKAGENIQQGMRVKQDPKSGLCYLAEPFLGHLIIAPVDIKEGQMFEVNLATGKIRVLPEQK
jgi:hypothetical protein